MSLTATEELRIRAIESKLNEIQTALNNLAGKSQLKSTLGVIQRQINELNDLIGQVESDSSAAALTVHKTNSAAHSEINNRFFQRTEFVTTSSGVDDAGKPLKLNADGNIDASLVSLSLENHNTLSGLDQDDHPHYLNTSRHSAITGNPHSVTASEINAASSSELNTVSGILQTQIDTKSDDGHIHDNRYYTETEVDVFFTDVNNNITTTSGLLQIAIDGKADIGHNHDSSYYTESEIDALLALLETADNTISGTLQTQIDNKADSSHTHDDRYYTESEIDGFGFTTTTYLDTVSGTLQTQIDTKSDSGHLHNEIYYTEAEVDDFVSDLENSITTTSGLLRIAIDGKSDLGHLHDDRYYTESEIDSFDYANNTRVDTVSGELQTQINTKSDTSHLHDDRYYTETEIDARFSASGINIAGTPTDNELTVWNDNNTISGANLKWNGELLQLGGETSSYPALKRSGTFIHARLADDSNYAYIVARQLQATDGIRVNGTGFFYWTDKSRLYSPTDGDLRIVNSTQDDFNMLQFGGSTSSFPALKRSTNQLLAYKADDSGYANFLAAEITGWSGIKIGAGFDLTWGSRSVITSSLDGNLTITNNAANDFGLLQFGGTTSSYPALKRLSAGLQVYKADDSGYAEIYTGAVYAYVNGFITGNPTPFRWSTRSRMYSFADGNIHLTNNASDDFNLLQFGGTTSSFPAIKRNSAAIDLRLADDSDYTDLNLNNLDVQGNLTVSGTVDGIDIAADTVRKSGTPVANQIAFFTDENTVSGDTGLAWNGSKLQFGTDGKNPTLGASGNGQELIVLRNDSANYSLIRCHSVYSYGEFLLANAGQSLLWNARSRVYSPVDGNLQLTNNASNDFSLLQFGGTSSSFPAIKRNAAAINFRLADDSDYANIHAGIITFNGGTVSGYLDFQGAGTTPSAGQIGYDNGFVFEDEVRVNSGNLLQFGGATSSDPALTDNGTWLDVKKADNSGYTGITAQAFRAIASFSFNSKTILNAPTDGDLLLLDSAGTDFGLLQLGGSTSSYPAIKRFGDTISLVKADDSGYTGLYSGAIISNSYIQCAGYSRFLFGSRSSIYSPVDGDIKLTNNANTDFNLLQFGGTTSSFPAIKRDNTDLSLRLADDSAMASLHVEDITVSGIVNTDNIYSLNNSVGIFTTGVSMVLKMGGPSSFANTFDMSGGNGTGGITWRSDVSSMHYWNTFKSHVFTYHTNRNINHDHGFQTDPTIFVHSSTSPNTDNTQWMGMTHDALNGVITTGTGSLVLNPANDTVLIADGAATSMIQFGGTTSTYPAIKKLANTLQIKLADDSGFAGLYTGAILANSYIQTAGTNHFRWESKSRMFSDVDGDIRLTDTTNADFNLLQFGGTTSSYPALKRSSTEIQSRLADDSAYANLRGNYISAEAGLSLGTGYYLTWSGRSRISSVADGDFRLTNQANNDFNMLQFGGITSSCPALKKSGVNLQARLADDSDYTDFTANTVSGVRGILPPALTNSEMDAIASPEQGLMIYNTTSGVMSVYDGSVWRSLAWV